MDDLLRKYTEYMLLENCRAEYLLANGQTIEAIYKEENFAHLLGLHKLIDIQIIQFWQDKSNKKVKLSNERLKIDGWSGAKCLTNEKLLLSSSVFQVLHTYTHTSNAILIMVPLFFSLSRVSIP